jgi:hypothetical protein
MCFFLANPWLLQVDCFSTLCTSSFVERLASDRPLRGNRLRSSSAPELTNMEAKPIFDVSSAMEATFHQRLDPLLAGRAFHEDGPSIRMRELAKMTFSYPLAL